VTLGERIYEARNAAEMTVEDLAVRLGVLPRTVSFWENDRSAPRGNRLSMLAGILGVSLQWLMTGWKPEDDAATGKPEQIDAIAAKLDRLTDLQAQATALATEIRSDIDRLRGDD
jgi:transcriptional regulator with XRE-family HTH domain